MEDSGISGSGDPSRGMGDEAAVPVYAEGSYTSVQDRTAQAEVHRPSLVLSASSLRRETAVLAGLTRSYRPYVHKEVYDILRCSLLDSPVHS